MPSCTSDENVLFEIDLQEVIFVPGGLNNIETHVFVVPGIPNLLNAYLESNGFSYEDISRIGSGSARLEGNFQKYNYSVLAEVEVDMLNSDGTERLEIFYQEEIPFNETDQVNLFGSLTDVKEIMKDDTYNLEIALRFRSPTTSTNEHLFSYKLLVYGQ